MNFNNLQLGISIFTGFVVAGAWWFIAFRLAFHWVLYALAFVASLSALLTMLFLALNLAGSLRPQFHQLIPILGVMRIGLSLLTAALLVIFAGWITSRAKAAAPPGQS